MSFALLASSSSSAVAVRSKTIQGQRAVVVATPRHASATRCSVASQAFQASSSWATGMNGGWAGGWKTGPSFSGHGSRQAASRSSSGSGGRQQQSQGSRTLALDFVTTQDAYLIYADIPGVSKSDLSIKCSKEQRVLTISGSRSTPTSTQDYRQQQRPFGAFERSWPLPVDADAAGVSAKVSDGVLLLTVKRLQKQDDEGEDIFIN